MSLGFIKFLQTIFYSKEGLISFFSFFALIFISYARKSLIGEIKSIAENLIALAFVTYLFTFFKILFTEGYLTFSTPIANLILTIYLVLIIIVIIKTTTDMMHYSRKTRQKRKRHT